MIDLSVVIVTWNNKELLSKCLTSIFKYLINNRYEVIVVDNASEDGSVEMVRKYFPQAKLIRNKVNLRYAGGNNVGIQKAKGRYVLLLNNDTLLVDSSLSKLTKILDKNPKVGALGPKLLNEDLTLQPSARNFPNPIFHFLELTGLVTFLPRSALIGKFYYISEDHNKFKSVDWVSGAALCLRRKALDQIGYLDEDYFFYSEEVDICYRLKKHGWGTFFTPEVRLIHYGNKSGVSLKETRFLQQLKSNDLFLAKHYSNIYRLLFRFVTTVALALMVSRMFFSLLIKGEDRAGNKRLLFRTYLKALAYV